MAQPLIALIRLSDPDGAIDVLAPPHVAAVFEAMSEVAEVIIARNTHGKLDLRSRVALANRLRRRRYQRCFVLPNSLKSALVPWLARIPERIGHRGEARHLLINRVYAPLPASKPGEHRVPMVEHYARLAFDASAGLPTHVADPELTRDPAAEAAVLRRFGIAPDEPVVVLCPGAEFGPAKRWPPRHFASLAAMIAAEWPEACMLLVGSPKDRDLATEIAALSGQPMRNLCGQTSLAEALNLIAQASGVVSNDSGMMHVAAAYGRPQVAVFGSSDPRHTPPRSPRAKVEWLHLECSPCFQRECPLKHTNCLNQMMPAAVFESLRKTMQFETASRPPR